VAPAQVNKERRELMARGMAVEDLDFGITQLLYHLQEVQAHPASLSSKNFID
jgi:hypothetical protein